MRNLILLLILLPALVLSSPSSWNENDSCVNYCDNTMVFNLSESSDNVDDRCYRGCQGNCTSSKECTKYDCNHCYNVKPVQPINVTTYFRNPNNDTLDSSIRYFNNIDFLTLGYNILEGYPLTENGLDPGFQTARIFNLADSLDTTADKRFYIPQGTSVVKELACQLSFDSKQVSTEKSLQDHLKTQVSGSGSYGGGSFKFSAEYDNLRKEFSSSSDLHVISKGECQVYRAWLNTYDPPKLSKYFVDDVKTLLLSSIERADFALLTDAEKQSYYDFIERYGTHFIKTMTLGAKLNIIKSVKANKGQTFGSTSMSLSAAASYSGLFSFSAESMYSHQTEAAEAFERQVSSTKTSTIGSRPPPDGDVNTWAQQSFEDPMPLKYTLGGIDELLLLGSQTYLGQQLKDDVPASTDPNILKNHMGKALLGYCAKKDINGDICNRDLGDFSSDFKPIISQTPTVGGAAVGEYIRDAEIASFGAQTTKIQVRYGNDKEFQAIRAFISDNNPNFEPDWHGYYSETQTQEEFLLYGERIASVKVWADSTKGVTGLAFVDERGTSSKVYGRRSGSPVTVNITGVLSSFHGSVDGATITTLGFLSFEYLTRDEQEKTVMFATPLYGNNAQTGFFQDYDMNAKNVRLRVIEGNWIDAIGVCWDGKSDYSYHGYVTQNGNKDLTTADFYEVQLNFHLVGSDKDNEAGLINLIPTNKDGSTQTFGSSEGDFSQYFYSEDYGGIDALELKGIYGRNDTIVLSEIGFVFARTYKF